MSHGQATDWGKDNASKYKARIGIWMFFIYSIVYLVFIVISSLMPQVMKMPFLGMNIAIVYGYGLILFAFFFAFLYSTLCSRMEEKLNLKAKEVATWFDELSAQKRIPQDWDKEKVLAFCDALLSLESEVNMSENEANLTPIEAFQSLFVHNPTINQ